RGRRRKNVWKFGNRVIYPIKQDKARSHYVLCEPSLLIETVDNIFSNAFKHNAEYGTLEVQTYEPERAWELTGPEVVQATADKDKRVRLVFTTVGSSRYAGDPHGPTNSTLRRQFEELQFYDAWGRVVGQNGRMVTILDFRLRTFEQAAIADPEAELRRDFN